MPVPSPHQPANATADARRDAELRRPRRPGGALVYGLLLLAGLCCLGLSAPRSWWQSAPASAVADARRTAATAPRLLARPICDFRPGQRVLAENPEFEGLVVEPLEIAPDHWRLIRLKMAKPDGGTLSIELLRPVLWLQLAALETLLEDAEMDDEAIDAFLDHIEDEAGLRGVLLGSTIELDLEELGAAGPAEVVEIAPCPELQEGEGRIVTGTFSHTAANVIDVHVSGLAEPIGTTDTHPFWSEDRQAFVPAGELRVGEQLRSLVRSQSYVTAIRPRGPPEAVYNLEVDGEHVYYVAESGLLVHNNCLGNNMVTAGQYGDVGTAAHHIVAKNHKMADGARRILDDLGFTKKDLDKAFDGVWLRRNSQVASRARGAIHSRLHTRAYFSEVQRRLASAESKAQAIHILQGIRRELLQGTFPF